MKVKMSEFLSAQKPVVKKLVTLLSDRFDYVSVLGTDVTSRQYAVRDKTTNIGDSSWTERGFVARVYSEGRYFEYSFNQITMGALPALAESIYANAKRAKRAAGDIIDYPLISEEEISESFFGEVEIMPGDMTSEEIVKKLTAINQKAHEYSEELVDFWVAGTYCHVSKIFISNKKDLEQSYVWSESYLMPIARRGEVTRNIFRSYSGLKGLEIFDQLEGGTEEAVRTVCRLLEAGQMPPGEYEVVCSPGAVGIIAHEAFGHGVEMDMFVKKRAKGEEYINKQVASDMVVMHDGAASASHVATYLFDDEGTVGRDTVIIQNGILKTGISDLLSALKLGTKPTGNGRRQSFEHKAYARMTNTFFESGGQTVEDMIGSISHGYFLDTASSGMEDPKDWGIQIMFQYAVEIVDGKLTDRVAAPVIMTGYVPDLLKSITMVASDFELEGAGGCGKGHKEWVKVSCGGPHIKAKARLG